MHFRSDPPAAPLVQQHPACYSWKSSSSNTNAPRVKVMDLPPDVALRLLTICKCLGDQSTSPLRAGRLINAKHFTRKQFKGCCIRDLAFVALTCAAGALNFTFPAWHFLPLSWLPLHIVSFQILSPLRVPTAASLSCLHSPMLRSILRSLQPCREAVRGVLL